jgi:hypothetical protein
MQLDQAELTMVMVSNSYCAPQHQTYSGPVLSALVVAIQMINVFTKQLKYKRRVVMVTDGRGEMDDDGLSDITSKMKSDAIELVTLLVSDVLSITPAATDKIVVLTSTMRSTAFRRRIRIH